MESIYSRTYYLPKVKVLQKYMKNPVVVEVIEPIGKTMLFIQMNANKLR